MRKLYQLKVLALLAILMLSTMAADAIDTYSGNFTITKDLTESRTSITGGGTITIAQGATFTNNGYLSLSSVQVYVHGKLVINSTSGSWKSNSSIHVYLNDGGSFEWNGNENFSSIPSYVYYYGYNAGTNGGGTVEVTKEGVAVESSTKSGYYDELTFTATPNSGYTFMNWTKGEGGEVIGTGPTISISCEENGRYQVYANFEREGFFCIEDYPSVTGEPVSLKQSAIGRVLCADGTISKNYSEAAHAGKTPVGMIAYIDWGAGKAYLVGLHDAGTNTLTASQAKNELTSLPVGPGGPWRVPTVDEWKKMFVPEDKDYPEYSVLFYCQDLHDMLVAASSGSLSMKDGLYWTMAESMDTEKSAYVVAVEETVFVNGIASEQTVHKAIFMDTEPSTEKNLLAFKEINITMDVTGVDFEERAESDGTMTLVRRLLSGTNEGQLADLTDFFTLAKTRDENAAITFSNGGDSPIAQIFIDSYDVSRIDCTRLVKFGAKYQTYADTRDSVNIVFDFRMEDRNGTPVSLGMSGSATVSMPYGSLVPAGKTPIVWNYNRETLMEENCYFVEFDPSTKVFSFTVSSF